MAIKSDSPKAKTEIEGECEDLVMVACPPYIRKFMDSFAKSFMVSSNETGYLVPKEYEYHIRSMIDSFVR